VAGETDPAEAVRGRVAVAADPTESVRVAIGAAPGERVRVGSAGASAGRSAGGDRASRAPKAPLEPRQGAHFGPRTSDLHIHGHGHAIGRSGISGHLYGHAFHGSGCGGFSLPAGVGRGCCYLQPCDVAVNGRAGERGSGGLRGCDTNWSATAAADLFAANGGLVACTAPCAIEAHVRCALLGAPPSLRSRRPRDAAQPAPKPLVRSPMSEVRTARAIRPGSRTRPRPPRAESAWGAWMIATLLRSMPRSRRRSVPGGT
jgi:hypothetical protein